jgi:thiol:disulfide interchange protein
MFASDNPILVMRGGTSPAKKFAMSRTRRLEPLAVALACALASPTVALAAPAPHVPVASFDQLPQPLPLPYDEHADADHAVQAALQRAKAQHKLLMVDLGGNWCLDCRLLAATMEIPVLKAWLARHYEIVSVDIGRFDRNLQIPARLGAPGRPAGVPALLIVDPRSGSLVNRKRIAALSDARSMSPQGLADWLAQWVV